MDITIGNLVWGKAQDVIPTQIAQKINQCELGIADDRLQPSAQDAFLQRRAEEHRAMQQQMQMKLLQQAALPRR